MNANIGSFSGTNAGELACHDFQGNKCAAELVCHEQDTLGRGCSNDNGCDPISDGKLTGDGEIIYILRPLTSI